MNPSRRHTRITVPPLPLARHADGVGILFSALCAVHCLLPAMLPWIALAGFGAVVFRPDYEPWFKLGAITIAGMILIAGFVRHRHMQPAFCGLLGIAAMLLTAKVDHAWEPMMIGTAATLLCLAHYRNWRLLNPKVPPPELPSQPAITYNRDPCVDEGLEKHRRQRATPRARSSAG